MKRFDNIVELAEAYVRGQVELNESCAVGRGRWYVGAGQDPADRFLIPGSGGRAYELAYVLGEGREAIIRTAQMRRRYQS